MSLSIEESENLAEETLQNLSEGLRNLKMVKIISIVLIVAIIGCNAYLYVVKKIHLDIAMTSLIIGVFLLAVSFVSNMLRKNVERKFIKQFDMTQLFDVSDEQKRFEEYQKILAIRIREDSMTITPVMTRGNDEKGPDWGKTDFKMGSEPVRRDAIIEGKKYEGMEGDLTQGEQLRATADVEYTVMAQERWERAEANDPDLIEYGVGKLGDLVRTDYFEKNAEEGIFSKIAKTEDEEDQQSEA
jgi:hypothetical protein